MRLSRIFDEDEFRCSCCGAVEMDSGFIRDLQAARDLAKVPFRIVSGYRCSVHNDIVGGTPGSSHLRGLAADIAIDSSSNRYVILYSLILSGFRRIGISSSYIHVDGDQSKPQGVVWVYG